jgi:signal transduction histidine kinase
MRGLPSIQSCGDRIKLPLTHSSAAELARLLVLPGDAQPAGALDGAVANDPALALWCVIREATLRTAADSAAWLQAHATRVLMWPEDAPSIDSQHQPRYAELAAAAIGVAELAIQVAQRRQADAEQARLIGLLHQAGEWLAVAGDTAAANDLPDWLREAAAIANAAPRKDDATPAGCAALARAIIVDGAAAPAGMRLPRGLQSGGRQRRTEEVRRAWLHPTHLAADWLPELAARLTRLSELETSFAERLETEKLESLAELAAGAGHEINNPLAVISGRVQLFLREERDPERRRDLAVLNTQSLRVHEMIADMMLFARPPRPRPEPVNLAALIDRLLADLGARAAERDIELVRSEDASALNIEADPTQIMVALRAVCENALQAIGRDGRIEIAAGPSPTNPDGVEITVRDSGPGIPPAVRRHLFDPFYSGRQSGRGLGMGLAKCWRIVTNHGGRIDVESEPGQGACFTIRLPRVADVTTANTLIR